MKAAPEPPNLDNRVESFFVDENANFFRPLVGRYREVVVSCLRELYSRLYSWDADYNVHLNREDVLTIIQGAISRTAILESDPDMDASDETYLLVFTTERISGETLITISAIQV